MLFILPGGIWKRVRLPFILVSYKIVHFTLYSVSKLDLEMFETDSDCLSAYNFVPL